MNQFRFIGNLSGWKGDARLFAVNPPVKYDDKETSFVIVSGVYVIGKPETYIFPADESGECLSFVEMDGSFKGAIDHEKALQNAGYGAANATS